MTNSYLTQERWISNEEGKKKVNSKMSVWLFFMGNLEFNLKDYLFFSFSIISFFKLCVYIFWIEVAYGNISIV